MERFKQNRCFSFAAVSAVYVIAAVIGILIYNALQPIFWLSLLIADIAATVVVFAFSLIFKNASVYDPYWSVQPIIIVAAFLFSRQISAMRILIFAAVLIWGVRLTANWAYTFKNLMHEDWRYVMLKEQTGRLYVFVNFFGIHLVPTLIVYACTLPAVYAVLYNPAPNLLTGIFFVIAIIAVLIELVSDADMHRFKKRGKGGYIRSGLWKNCRHPNYFGEILFWWAIGLMAVSVNAEWWYLLAGAFANTLLFVFVSLPMAEKKQGKKQGFIEYKRETNLILPIRFAKTEVINEE